MSGAEVVHRAGATLRDRFAPPAWSRWSPEVASGRLFAAPGSPLSLERFAAVTHLPPPSMLEGTRNAAAALERGRWMRFGREVALGDPPRWNVDPGTGAAWPERPSREIDYRRTDLAGGAKGVWEAGRLTMLPTLALAARSGGARVAGERARRWLDDFVERQPLGFGVHHTSGIEMAIRTITMSWTLALLAGGAGRDGLRSDDGVRSARRAAALIAQQALWCRDHRSLGSSANNHLLSEYAGMVVAGAGLPGLRGADALADQGLAGLEHELPRQIHADGVTAEQAFRYLPFVWELVLPALRLAEASGRRIAATTRERLAASLEFARTLRRGDGTLPPVGDEDDARILLADETGSRLDLAGNALAAWLGRPGLTDGAQALAHLLNGRASDPAAAAADGLRVFADGGCTAWRSGNALATFDHGPLGLGTLAAHGHADALAFTLRLGDDDLVVDPGTLAYHEDEAARERSRATPSHPTVHFGGRSQSESLGPFLWGRRARVVAEGDGYACEWWTGERHVRRIAWAPGEIAILDRVSGSSAEFVLPLAPGATARTDGTSATIESGRSQLRIESEGLAGWRTEAAEVATRFGDRRPALRIAATFAGNEAATRLRFGPR